MALDILGDILKRNKSSVDPLKSIKGSSLSNIIKNTAPMSKPSTPLKPIQKPSIIDTIKNPTNILKSIITTGANYLKGKSKIDIAKDIISNSDPVDIVKQKVVKPYSLEVGKELVKSIKDTGTASKEIFTTKKSGAIKANNLWQAVSGIPASLITPVITKTIELSGQGDVIANTLIDLGKKEAKIAKLNEKELTDTDYINLGATNIDVATAGLGFLVTKGLSKGIIRSLVKGLKTKGDNIKIETPKMEITGPDLSTKLKLPDKKEIPVKSTEIISAKPKSTLSELITKGTKIESPVVITKPKSKLVDLIGETKPDIIGVNPKIKETKPLIATIKDIPEIKDIKDFKILKTDSILKKEEDPINYEILKSKENALNNVVKGKINKSALDKLKTGDYEIVTHVTKDLNTLKGIVNKGYIEARKNTDFPLDDAGVYIRPGDSIPYNGQYVVEIVVPKNEIKNIGGNVNDSYIQNNVQANDFVSIQKRDDYIPTNKTIEPTIKEGETPFGTLQEKTVNEKYNNLQDVISADINKTPDLKFELGIVQKQLQKIPGIRQAGKIASKGFIDIRNKLNNILVVGKDGLQGLADTITGIGNRKKQIVEQSIKDFGIEDLVNWSKSNSKELLQTRNNLESRLKELYTIDGKLDKTGFEVAKSHLNHQYYESNFKNPDLDNLRFISNIYFYLNKFYGKDIINDLPVNIQNKIKELDDNISVKYDEDFDVINPQSKEHEMTTILGQYLEDIGLLRYKRDGYKRGVINKEVFDFIRKNKKDIGEDIDIGDFQDFIRKGYDTTINQTGDIPKWMSSVLKKSKNAEKYHSQDPITRMISYADEVGQLIANKEVVDLVNNARKSGKDINQYIGKDADDFVKKTLGLHDIGLAGRITGKVSGGLGATAIIGSLPIMTMSGITTLARATPTFFRNILGLRFRNDINKTIDFLEKSGIEQKFINETGLDKFIGGSYSVFGGGYLDKKTKGLLGSMIIKNQLNDLGVKIGKGENAIDIYSKNLNTLPVARSNKLVSDIGRQLNDLSDFSNLSKGQISGLDSRIFNTFKNFGRTTASRYVSYPTQIINEVYSTIKNKLPKGQLADRSYQKIAFLVADAIGVYLISQAIVYKMYGKEGGEEEKKILTNKMSGGDLKDKLAMLLSYPLQQPGISMVSSTFNNIVKLVEDISNNGINKDQIDYTKLSGLVRQLSILMKDKEVTSGGTYKYNNEWGDDFIQNTLLFLLGKSGGQLDYETAKKNIEKIQEGDKGLMSSVVDNIIKDQNFFYSGLGETFDIAKYGLGDRDTQNDFYNFKVRSESKKNIDTLISNIKYGEKIPLSAEKWIANAWDGFDVKVDDKDIITFMKTNLASNKSEQKALLETINELGINNDPLYKGDMNEYMDKLKTKNPALFYQIMKKIINPVVVKIDKDTKEIKDLQYTGSETGASFVDEILVERFENLPRLASDIANKFDKLISENPTDEDLASYNELIKTTANLPYLWDDISDSLSTMAGKKLKALEGIKDKLGDYPELQNLIKQALVLRGMKFRDNTLPTNQIEELGVQVQPTSGETTQGTMTGGISTSGKKNNKLVDLIKLEKKKSDYDPIFDLKGQGERTLVDILRKS